MDKRKQDGAENESSVDPWIHKSDVTVHTL